MITAGMLEMFIASAQAVAKACDQEIELNLPWSDALIEAVLACGGEYDPESFGTISPYHRLDLQRRGVRLYSVGPHRCGPLSPREVEQRLSQARHIAGCSWTAAEVFYREKAVQP